MKTHSNETIRKAVRDNYGKIAQNRSGCGCSSNTCCGTSENPDILDHSMLMGYSIDEILTVPEGTNLGLGCGNPQTIASLKPGETVLDLGSGAGFDSFLAARSVGETGRVIGVDMTREMIEKASEYAKLNNCRNIEFRLGEIENLPVDDQTIDVIMSNCVINLSPEKPKVFAEAYRVLVPGGRLAVSDVITTAELPADIRQDLQLYSDCVSGAITAQKLENMLEQSGFKNIKIHPMNNSKAIIREWVPDSNIDDYIISAYIEAIKPF